MKEYHSLFSPKGLFAGNISNTMYRRSHIYYLLVSFTRRLLLEFSIVNIINMASFPAMEVMMMKEVISQMD